MDNEKSNPVWLGQKAVIGIIGGIGSGKSAVAAEFARQGAAVISGDQLGHEALQQPEIRSKVIEHFGPAIVESNGAINRRILGAIVFADRSKRSFLPEYVKRLLDLGFEDARHHHNELKELFEE